MSDVYDVMAYSPHQQRVERFMQLADQHVPLQAFVPNRKTRELRAKLILEEAAETIQALGFSLTHDPNTGGLAVKPSGDCDVEGVLDGCGDLSVVTIGTLSAFGIPDEPVLAAVDHANLRKFGPGSYQREDGKWMKPPDWQPPDMMAIWKAMEPL